MEEYLRSRVPWSTEPSLETKAKEVGINFDALIDGIKNDKSDEQMGEEFGVNPKTIGHLREHFMTRGIGSIVGQD
ncbi:helix-turn-helix domain-containing protein [Desulforamulus aquiferis]|uniref:Helix-turn-helix domain-containing protein n=1 Tax=Desulforamulus aquiferis TaxID=1397668 RepID=A0AAW7ZE57_9FIRM|nr:helix-turn-helix domain-containing protein [Desulforamulus aquiferis]MDO7787439.1 helix-turn-helix domain-containing protein [Desulforamulus aquiferis]